MPRIDFLNPFGTPAYDELIRTTLGAYARPDTELVVSHLEGCPRNIDYYWYKHLVEAAVFEHVLEAERGGFDAVIVGCCYDPGVRVARELVDIPVVGPLEAALALAPYVGHSTAVVTDHRKAVPYLEDLVRLYGREGFCRGVDAIDWWVTDMVEAPLDTARDAYRKCGEVLDRKRAESVVLGCTIVAACLEYAILQGHREYLEVPVVNPNVAALKTAESLADLHRLGRYAPNRAGYYGRPQDHDPAEYEEVLRTYTRLGRGRA